MDFVSGRVFASLKVILILSPWLRGLRGDMVSLEPLDYGQIFDFYMASMKSTFAV